MRVILRSPARIHSSPEVFRRAVWQLGPKSRVHSCVSFSPPQSRLTLLLFSLLHACHSCRPLRQRQRAAFFVRAPPLQSIFRHIFPAPCVMMCAFLRPQVLRHHPPSCGCGRTHRALRNVLPPRASWHGLTHARPVHRDGLHGCQWKQRRAASGPEGGGSRDLHDCFQESLGAGETPQSSFSFNSQSALNRLLFTWTVFLVWIFYRWSIYHKKKQNRFIMMPFASLLGKKSPNWRDPTWSQLLLGL